MLFFFWESMENIRYQKTNQKKEYGLVVAVQRVVMGGDPIDAALMRLGPNHRPLQISSVLGIVQLVYVRCCGEGLLPKALVVVLYGHSCPRSALFLALVTLFRIELLTGDRFIVFEFLHPLLL